MSAATRDAVRAHLPEGVRSSLPWQQNALQELDLPKDAKVPEGALQTGRSDRGLLMRSTAQTSLVEFCMWKQSVLHTLRSQFGDSVYISGFEV